MRVIIALLTLAAPPEGTATRAEPTPAPVTAEARLDVTQLVSDDSVTDRHLVYTDRRATADLPGGRARPLALHADVLGRISANDAGPSRYDVSRLYLEYGDPAAWTISAGRIGVESVNQTLVDGARFKLALADDAHVEAFAGAMPHPIRRTVTLDFFNFGAGYQVRGKAVGHGGGFALQLYRGEVDRAFVTEGASLRLGAVATLFSRVVVDVVSQGGVDLSQAYLTLRLRPTALFDVSVTGSHVHALLPNRWWQDWVEQERARLGFSLDGPLPVGSRRSTARVVGNLHFGDLSPYVALRYDHRHEDARHGYEGRAGLKYARRGLGYLDLYGAHRRSFDAQHQLLGLQLGLTVVEGVELDAGAGALRLTPPEGGPTWLFDVNATAWLDLGTFAPALRRAFVLGMYQAFIEPDVLFQVVIARIGYRLSL